MGAALFLPWGSQDPTPMAHDVTQASDGDDLRDQPGSDPKGAQELPEDAPPSPDPSTAPAPVPVVPSTLYIPSVGISAPIVEGGADGGEMVLPESSKVAQYTEAAPLEAEDGSTVIAGHVNFTDGSWGALGPLHQVREGDPVYVTDSEGEVRQYVVSRMSVLHKESLPYQIFRTEGERQLVVVTCGGDVEKVGGEWVYTQNLVVYAMPVAS